MDLNSRISMTSLDLTSNHLTKIEFNTFKGLRSLRHLKLANNRLDSIDSFTFSEDLLNSRELTELDLSHNYLSDNSMEFLIFANLPKLKNLKLDSNQLKIFSSQLVLNLYSLEKLGLSENNLKVINLFL